jgi:hypothetical protein
MIGSPNVEAQQALRGLPGAKGSVAIESSRNSLKQQRVDSS